MSVLRGLIAAALTIVGLLVPSTTATGQVTCRPDGWSVVDAEGVPVAMGQAGWGECPSRPHALWWARWSYPDYPLVCVPQDSPLPAWQFIWVTDAGRPKVPLVESRHDLFSDAVHRAVSVFAASRDAAITDRAGLAASSAPRVVTFAGPGGRCEPLVDLVTVPHAVLQREPYQMWTDPRTGEQELGLWPWLETHGYPARDNRRYITITDTSGVWNFLGGATIVPCSGSGYGPADTTPGPQNCNQEGGTWMTLSTDNRTSDFQANSTGSFGERLAHEFAHGMGAVLEGSPDAHPQNPLHPSDCADLLCYNTTDIPGQSYQRCGGSPRDTWEAFDASGADTSRAAYRLDCGRDDYYAYHLRGRTVVEKAWAADRWSGEHNRFYWGGTGGYAGPVFSNLDYPIAPECTYDPDGWCPPGVAPTAAVENPTPRTAAWVAVP